MSPLHVNGLAAVSISATSISAGDELSRALFEQVTDSIFVTDPVGRLVDVNPPACRLLGYSHAELLALPLLDLLSPADLTDQPFPLDALRCGQLVSREWRLRCQDGTLVAVAIRFQRLSDGRLLGIAHLLPTTPTAYPPVEQALRESEARYRTLISTLSVALYTTDAEGYLTFCNEAAIKLWGRHPRLGVDRWCGSWQLYRLDGEMLPHDQCAMATALREKRAFYAEELMAIRPDQSRVLIAAYPTPIYDEQGLLIGGINVLVDLTARKAAEAALHEMAENMAAAQRIAHFGSWEVKLDEQLALIEPHLWSNECCRIFGYEPGTAITTEDYFSRIHPDDFSTFHAAAQQDLRAGRSGTYAYRIIRPDGAIRHIYQQKTIILDEQSKRPIKIIGTVHDVTERKVIEDALRIEQERLAKIVAGVPGMIFIFRMDLDGATSVPYCSPSVGDLLQIDPQTLVQDATLLFERVHPDDVATAFAMMQASRVTLAASYFEFRVQHPQKGQIWVEVHTSPARAADGAMLWYGFAADITDRKRTQEQLHYQANLLANVNDAVVATDLAFCITSWNRGAEQLYGWSAAEVIGQPLNAVIKNEYTDLSAAEVVHHFMTYESWRGEATQQHRDGSRFHVMAVVSLVKDTSGETIGTVGIVRDVTQQKEAEAALRNSEERFNKAFLATPAAMIIVRQRDGYIVDVNDAFLTLMGYSRSQLIGSTFSDLNIFIEDRSQIQRLLRKQGAVHNREQLLRDQQGERHHVIFSAELFGLAGELHILAIAFDITARKQAEERLQVALTAASMGVWEWDVQNEQLFWSPECYLIFGVADAKLSRFELFAYVHPEDAERVAHNFSQALATQQIFTDEFRILRGDSTVRWVSNLGIGIYHEEGQLLRVVGTIQDITVRKENEAARAHLEEQLHQSQKMETIGRLAGGVAHDFNNLLTVIQGYSDMLLVQVGTNSPHFNKIEQISQAGKRAANLTNQLLAFSRRQLLTPTTVDLNSIITNLQRMLARLIGEDIMLTTALHPTLWTVTVDSSRMEQVIMNLVVNARDAMPTGGLLTIRTSNVFCDARESGHHPDALSGPCVLLAVTDTGSGMDEQIRVQIFEPFFTTKEQGKGTGLGLSTVYGIVKQSGGDIIVESKPNVGSTFNVYLPANQEVPQSDTLAAQDLPPQRGSETILLVEDEEMVRDLVQFSLEEAGYPVLAADSGRAALALVEQHPGPIHLLMTDVVMPEMSGRELAEHFTRHYPTTKVLFTSGYTDDAVVRHGLLTAEVAFLQKPFTLNALLVKVRAMLDE